MPESAKARKLDAYVAYLHERLAIGAYNAHKLYQELLALGYPDKERQVRAFVQPFRPPRLGQARFTPTRVGIALVLVRSIRL